MKRIFFMVLFIVFALSQISYAQVAGATVKGQKPDGSFDWIQLDADKKLITSGSGGTSTSNGTWTIILPAIASSTTYTYVLATGTSRKLSEIASFSNGDLIMFQGESDIRWGMGVHTAAQLNAGKGITMEALSSPFQANLRSGMDLSFVGKTAVSTLTVIVNSQQ